MIFGHNGANFNQYRLYRSTTEQHPVILSEVVVERRVPLDTSGINAGFQNHLSQVMTEI